MFLAIPAPPPAIYENFNSTYVVEESGYPGNSMMWWLNSGAYFFSQLGRGKTVFGSLPQTSYWRVLYSQNNSQDTDDGYHPQNIFRLVTTASWADSRQSAYFRISKDNLSTSPNRNASNGLLLFARYQDENNLYYVGVRVDGNAVIKKKQNGKYQTLAIKKIFAGTYDRNSLSSLLPKQTWVGLKLEIKNLVDGKVELKLFTDINWKAQWTQALSATDASSPITKGGKAGIRTDFMDVEFDNYQIDQL